MEKLRRNLKDFFAAVLVFFLLCCPFRGGKEIMKIDVTQDKLLCGTNSLFVALGLLGQFPKSYDEMLLSFPNVKKEGSRLSQLKSYLDTKTNLYSGIRFCTNEGISKMDKNNCVALVVRETRPIAHISIKRPCETGIQIIDFPNIPNIEASPFQKKKFATLLVSSQPIASSENYTLLVFGGIFLCFL
jgi:hypothetical protein